MAASEEAPTLDLGEVAASFRENGCVVIRGLFSPEQVAALSAAYDDVFKTAQRVLKEAMAPGQPKLSITYRRDGSPNFHIERDGVRFDYQVRRGVTVEEALANPVLDETLDLLLAAHCGPAHPDLEAIGGGDNPGLLALATALLGRECLAEEAKPGEPVRLTQIIQQAHFKPPNSHCAFPWHQDSQFRRIHHGDFVDVNGVGSYCNIAVAIDPEFLGGSMGPDDGEHNGPLGVIPETHRDGHLGGAEGLDASAVDATKAVYPVCQPGDAICIGPYIVHGSEANASRTRWRRSFIFGAAVPRAIQNQVESDENRERLGMSWFKDRDVPDKGTPCRGRLDDVVV